MRSILLAKLLAAEKKKKESQIMKYSEWEFLPFDNEMHFNRRA